MPNRLIHSTSPYLLQHAHNPVDWFEWGPEALEKAAREDKPILVSIGYSSCHWCHVMERESFEKEDVARVMNNFFVCIKVDREERPDIDQIYMEAVQLLGVNGGWPLNVFLTPGQKPFFGGTYFTPQVWVQVLNNINNAYQRNRKQIEDTAEELRLHLLTSEVARYKQKPDDAELIPALYEMYNNLQLKFDKKWGGLDKAPKFVMPAIWLFLLRLAHLTKNTEAQTHIVFTLQKIAMGGIYDQIGGGFARYSVDRYWFAPHFEKMLYDNAQLLSLYSEAFAITGNGFFKTIIYETYQWLVREMTNTDGGFFSAIDADSEGVEGKFYIWTQAELKDVLGPDEKLLSSYYSVKSEGNWEHGNNILMRMKDEDRFLQEHSLTAAQWERKLKEMKTVLLQKRESRVRPGLDDKIITGWNAMTICGLVDAYRAFSDPIFLNAALKNVHFIEKELTTGNRIYRSYKNKRSGTPGFLDDYAFFIQALIKLYQVTFHEQWIQRAATLLQFTIDQFYDSSDGFFFYTAGDAEKLISRKKEIFDNVIPSSNAVMAQNLNYLSTIFDRGDWKRMATEMVESLGQLIKTEPGFMSYWAIVFTELKNGLTEIVVKGENVDDLRSDLLRHYLPFSLIQGSANGSNLPLVNDKTVLNDQATIYVCHNKTCKLPVHTIDEALQQLQ